MPKSLKDYLNKPNNCPYCDSDHISGGFVEVNDASAFQEIVCTDCDGEWTDHYSLTAVTFVEKTTEHLPTADKES